MRRILLLALLALSSLAARASYVLLPMDDTQTNHLKAYGVAYWVLQQNVEVDWLLNYQGGSFLFRYDRKFESELSVRGISYQVISDAQQAQITAQVSQPDVNMDVMRLDKPPKIAVYSPKAKQPWDDAVTMVLVYAEIPYEIVYDGEVLDGKLPRYDWLHLHHEDFTGQHGKFYRTHGNTPWYRAIQKEDEATAAKYGFSKVSQMKLNVVKKVRDFCAGGGFLFAMCSAADTYDIALSADGLDICESVYDGDPSDPNAQKKARFQQHACLPEFYPQPRPVRPGIVRHRQPALRTGPERRQRLLLAVPVLGQVGPHSHHAHPEPPDGGEGIPRANHRLQEEPAQARSRGDGRNSFHQRSQIHSRHDGQGHLDLSTGATTRKTTSTWSTRRLPT
jgi:hypothetical protein